MTGRLLFYHLRPSYIGSVCGNAIYEHMRHSMTADEAFGTIQPQPQQENRGFNFQVLTMDECFDTPFIRFHKAHLAHLVPREKLSKYKMYALAHRFNECLQSAKRPHDFYSPSHDCTHGNTCSKLATTCTFHDKHLQVLLPRLNGISLAHKAKLWSRMYGIECQFVVDQGLVCQFGDFQLNGHCQNNHSLHTRGSRTMCDLGTIGNTG